MSDQAHSKRTYIFPQSHCLKDRHTDHERTYTTPTTRSHDTIATHVNLTSTSREALECRGRANDGVLGSGQGEWASGREGDVEPRLQRAPESRKMAAAHAGEVSGWDLWDAL